MWSWLHSRIRSAVANRGFLPNEGAANRLAERFEVQVSYAIGVARPLSVSIECLGTNTIAEEDILRLINEHFDLRPGAIIRDLGLRRPIYRQTAAYGQFGRDDIDLPWERLDKVEALRRAATVSRNSRTVSQPKISADCGRKPRCRRASTGCRWRS